MKTGDSALCATELGFRWRPSELGIFGECLYYNVTQQKNLSVRKR